MSEASLSGKDKRIKEDLSSELTAFKWKTLFSIIFDPLFFVSLHIYKQSCTLDNYIKEHEIEGRSKRKYEQWNRVFNIIVITKVILSVCCITSFLLRDFLYQLSKNMR